MGNKMKQYELKGPGDDKETGQALAKGGSISPQQQGGNDESPFRDSDASGLGGPGGAQPQQVGDKPNEKEDEFTKDLETMDDPEGLKAKSPLGNKILQAFGQDHEPEEEPEKEEPEDNKEKQEEARMRSISEMRMKSDPLFRTQVEMARKTLSMPSKIARLVGGMTISEATGFLEANGLTEKKWDMTKGVKVPVYSADKKKLLGHVDKRATSVGAAKVGKSRTAYSGKVNGKYAWIVKEDYQGDEQEVTDKKGNPIDVDDLEFREAQKTEPTQVVQMDEPFIVQTKEGPAKGRTDDYLAQGVEDEFWPIDREIFDKTHKFVEESVKYYDAHDKEKAKKVKSREEKKGHKATIQERPPGCLYSYRVKVVKEVKGLAAPDFETEVELDESIASHLVAQIGPGTMTPQVIMAIKNKIDNGINEKQMVKFLSRLGFRANAVKSIMAVLKLNNAMTEAGGKRRGGMFKTSGTKEWGKTRKKGKHSKRNPRKKMRAAARRQDKELAQEADKSRRSLSHGGNTATGSDPTHTYLSSKELSQQELDTIDKKWKQILAFADAAFKAKPYAIAIRAITKKLERGYDISNEHSGKITDVIASVLKQDKAPTPDAYGKVRPKTYQGQVTRGSGYSPYGFPQIHSRRLP